MVGVSLQFLGTQDACSSSNELFRSFPLDIELVVCHFFIYGIPHWEYTTVFCKIEGGSILYWTSVFKTEHQNKGSYTVRRIKRDIRAEMHTHTLHSKHGAWSEQQLHQKLVPYTQSRQIDWFWQVCPNLSGVICSHLHMRRHWHKLAQARGWCPLGEAAVSLQIYSGLWESSHNWGSGGAWQVL